MIISDRVTSEEMDEGNCETPGPIGNAMPEENAGDNEMTAFWLDQPTSKCFSLLLIAIFSVFLFRFMCEIVF